MKNDIMKKVVSTSGAPAAIGPYSQAIEIGDTLYLSGQIPIDPASGKLIDGGIVEQTRQIMKNIGAILEAAGFSYADVVKSTCMLDDLNNFKAFNEVYAEFYPQNPPARSTFQVVKLPMGALVEVETIAVRQK
jgi:2-iminobutanoate/2-iminopropanoate deaminase